MIHFGCVTSGDQLKRAATQLQVLLPLTVTGTHSKPGSEVLGSRAALSRCGLIKADWRRAQKEPPALPAVWRGTQEVVRLVRRAVAVTEISASSCLFPLSLRRCIRNKQRPSPGTNSNPSFLIHVAFTVEPPAGVEEGGRHTRTEAEREKMEFRKQGNRR